MDFTPYVQGGERVLIKQRSERGNGVFIELALCFTLWLVCLACDCFFFGAMTKIRETTKVSESYLFVLVPSVVIHIVPFAAWMFAVLKRLSPHDEKWYAVTDRRIAVVSGVKPVSVSFLNLADVTSISLGSNKVTVWYGDEKLVLNGLAEPDALYSVLDKYLFPDESSDEKATEPDIPTVIPESVAKSEVETSNEKVESTTETATDEAADIKAVADEADTVEVAEIEAVSDETDTVEVTENANDPQIVCDTAVVNTEDKEK